MNAQDTIITAKTPCKNSAFRSEFGEALDELVNKIRYRGQHQSEWIAEQIASGLAEQPGIRKHLVTLLEAYDLQDGTST